MYVEEGTVLVVLVSADHHNFEDDGEDRGWLRLLKDYHSNTNNRTKTATLEGKKAIRTFSCPSFFLFHSNLRTVTNSSDKLNGNSF